jgi:hypothetical protein
MKITPFSDHRIVGDTMTSLIWHNVVNSTVIGNETFERGESPEIQEKLLLHHASLSFLKTRSRMFRRLGLHTRIRAQPEEHFERSNLEVFSCVRINLLARSATYSQQRVVYEK